MAPRYRTQNVKLTITPSGRVIAEKQYPQKGFNSRVRQALADNPTASDSEIGHLVGCPPHWIRRPRKR